MQHITYQCDLAQCRSETKTFEGWIALKQTAIPSIILRPMTTKQPGKGWKHYCGEAHAIQAASEAIGRWKTKPVTEEDDPICWNCHHLKAVHSEIDGCTVPDCNCTKHKFDPI